MSLKRVLALADGRSGDPSALVFAAWLAAQHDAVVEVIPVYPDSAMDMITLGMTLGATLSREAIDELAAAERTMQERIERVAREAADGARVAYGAGQGGPRMSVLTRGLRPALAVSRNAALADLLVIARDALGEAPVKDILSQVLLADRAPVLIAGGDPDRLSGPAAIAWDGSPQAGRAVRAALPLLAMASAIHVLQCVDSLDRHTTEPDIDLLNAYLKLHGVGTGIATLLEGAEEGATLIAAAEGKQAGLFVAGAWGHSRLREAIFGGATRTFLGQEDGPNLLLAH
ncbi:universal stress protein [Brevundimonas basaltis]|uniref:Nucleotide-binding universal stress UspA family protein n=1 Tax=Brevundimonas basaltis TaxID=472166 RepID=A0A7W8HW95_9CAUL|nr:universal stress protein [Brevundimonas basaltis]MBB5291093.1 nucleotide-binding universal stress UspA family protein [Brevundimonas basaltis]